VVNAKMSGPASASIAAAAGNRSAKLLDHPSVLGVSRRGVGLGEDRSYDRRDERAGRLGDLDEHVAKEVGPASLPAGTRKGGGDRVDQARMGIGDHQTHPRKASSNEAAKERGPAGAILGGVQLKAQDLPGSGGVDTGRDHAGHVADPAALAHLLVNASSQTYV